MAERNNQIWMTVGLSILFPAIIIGVPWYIVELTSAFAQNGGVK